MGEPSPKHPILTVSITSKSSDGGLRLREALAEIARRDADLGIRQLAEMQVKVEGTSESHLDSVCDRLREDFKLEIEASPPAVVYLETIRASAKGESKYIRQIGGKGNYAHCKLLIEPTERGKGNEFIRAMEVGTLPEAFITAINEGVQDGLKAGVIAGFRMEDVKVTLYDGSFHEVDSNEMSFRFAGSTALKEAARKASPVLMEPVMDVETTVRAASMGSVIGDINSRRGRIVHIDDDNDWRLIKAYVPLSEMLRASTYGCPAYLTRFAGYETYSRGMSDDGAANVPANRPIVPKAGRGSAAASLDSDPD